jgi:hypothetical protein
MTVLVFAFVDALLFFVVGSIVYYLFKQVRNARASGKDAHRQRKAAHAQAAGDLDDRCTRV